MKYINEILIAIAGILGSIFTYFQAKRKDKMDNDMMFVNALSDLTNQYISIIEMYKEDSRLYRHHVEECENKYKKVFKDIEDLQKRLVVNEGGQ